MHPARDRRSSLPSVQGDAPEGDGGGNDHDRGRERKAEHLWVSRLTAYVAPRLPNRLRWHLRRLFFDLKWFRKTLPSGLLARIDGFQDWEIYAEVFVEGVYDLAIDKALDGWSRRSPLRFLDLGANVGFFTLRLCDEVDRRFGPQTPVRGTLIDGNLEMCVQQRRRLIEDNHRRGIEVVHGLAGHRDGMGAFRMAPRHGHSALATAGGGAAVPFVDLAVLCAADAEIDILKMDIEGAELLVLENFPDLFRRVRVVTLELHADRCDAPRCRDLLRAAGFTHVKEQPLHAAASVYTVWR